MTIYEILSTCLAFYYLVKQSDAARKEAMGIDGKLQKEWFVAETYEGIRIRLLTEEERADMRDKMIAITVVGIIELSLVIMLLYGVIKVLSLPLSSEYKSTLTSLSVKRQKIELQVIYLMLLFTISDVLTDATGAATKIADIAMLNLMN